MSVWRGVSDRRPSGFGLRPIWFDRTWIRKEMSNILAMVEDDRESGEREEGRDG